MSFGTAQVIRKVNPGAANVLYGPPKLPPGFAEWVASLEAPPEPDYGTDPGYYTDSGGGGGDTIIYEQAPAPPPYDPNTDPAFQQLMAQLGLQENTERTHATQRIAQAQLEGAVAAPRVLEQAELQKRNINQGWEGRGLFRSGARLRDLAVQERGTTQRLGDIERGTARQVTGINQALAEKINQLAGQRLDATFQARMRSGSPV